MSDVRLASSCAPRAGKRERERERERGRNRHYLAKMSDRVPQLRIGRRRRPLGGHRPAIFANESVYEPAISLNGYPAAIEPVSGSRRVRASYVPCNCGNPECIHRLRPATTISPGAARIEPLHYLIALIYYSRRSSRRQKGHLTRLPRGMPRAHARYESFNRKTPRSVRSSIFSESGFSLLRQDERRRRAYRSENRGEL